MKKIFIILISLFFLLGVGFVYLVKNPELSIAQKVLPILGMGQKNSTNEVAKDSDLNNCTRYFDGCNTCAVQDGKIAGCTEMFCETPETPKCLEYITGTTFAGTLHVANPASEYCQKQSGTLKIVQGTDGEIGMCELKDGTVCEERLYMNGSCGATPQDAPSSTQTRETPSTPSRSRGSSLPKTIQPRGTTSIQNTMIPSTIPTSNTSAKITTTVTTISSGTTSINPGTGTSTTGTTSPNTTVCTMKYVPICAMLTASCTKAPCPATKKTFGNTCMMNANPSARFLHKGECTNK